MIYGGSFDNLHFPQTLQWKARTDRASIVASPNEPAGTFLCSTSIAFARGWNASRRRLSGPISTRWQYSGVWESRCTAKNVVIRAIETLGAGRCAMKKPLRPKGKANTLAKLCAIGPVDTEFHITKHGEWLLVEYRYSSSVFARH